MTSRVSIYDYKNKVDFSLILLHDDALDCYITSVYIVTPKSQHFTFTKDKNLRMGLVQLQLIFIFIWNLSASPFLLRIGQGPSRKSRWVIAEL